MIMEQKVLCSLDLTVEKHSEWDFKILEEQKQVTITIKIVTIVNTK